MSSIYARGQVLWVAFTDVNGRRRCASTGVRLGSTPQEREAALLEAKQVLLELEAGVASRRAAAAAGPMTVGRYAVRWVSARRARGLAMADDDEARLENHLLPLLGSRPLAEVRSAEIREAFKEIGQKDISTTTVRHIYGTIHCLFADAVAEELRDLNPCTLTVKRGELPERADRDPDDDVYTKDEMRLLVLDPRIPMWRRLLYALLFLTGMRIGEATARRWRDYEAETEPLGCLHVRDAFSTKRKSIGPTKTKAKRRIPIHPELARLLAAWKLDGWRRLEGHMPRPEDFIIPPPPLARSGLGERRPRTSKGILRALHRDCARLGIRRRRTHDTRASFISWCRALPGASDVMLKRITHGRGKKGILDVYTVPIWRDLCSQVAALAVDLREAIVVPVTAQRSREGT